MFGSMSIARWIMLLLVAGFVAHAHAESPMLEAPQFSADLIRINADGELQESTGRLYVAGNRVRIETPDFPGSYFLVDLAAHTSYFVQPEQRMIMEARLSSPLALVFLPIDPDDPCPKWQAQAERAGVAASDSPWRCERMGEDIVTGRHTIKFRVAPQQRHLQFVWIDPALRMPIRMHAAFGTAELIHIKIGAPQAELFKVPYEFRKFDPWHLIDRIKQSDVWVEPPPP